MTAVAATSSPHEPETRGPSPSLAQARLEDAYWQRYYWRERYYRPGCDYEDYAPAYCVGYVGFAQYGGSYEDAERSLVANWLRIRGDSSLTLEEAEPAIKAAWRRMEQAAGTAVRWDELHSSSGSEWETPRYIAPARSGSEQRGEGAPPLAAPRTRGAAAEALTAQL